MSESLDELKAKMEASRAEREKWLKSASPQDVLLWLMRHPDIDPSVQAVCAAALLPYMHKSEEAATEPPKQRGVGQ